MFELLADYLTPPLCSEPHAILHRAPEPACSVRACGDLRPLTCGSHPRVWAPRPGTGCAQTPGSLLQMEPSCEEALRMWPRWSSLVTPGTKPIFTGIPIRAGLMPPSDGLYPRAASLPSSSQLGRSACNEGVRSGRDPRATLHGRSPHLTTLSVVECGATAGYNTRPWGRSHFFSCG